MRSYNANSSVLSTSHRNSAIATTKAKTISVTCVVSLRSGQTTRFVSFHESRANAKKRCPGPEV